jgi:CPA2 family monovalent cation:H+ antiporter-2
VSFALGAFFAGMVLRESEFSHRAAEESLPLRDAFAVLFFVSVGMLFDPPCCSREPLQVLLVVAIIVVGKTIAAIALVLLLRYPLNTALTVGGQPGADRRVLLHPRRRWVCRWGCCRPRARASSGGALISIAANPPRCSLPSSRRSSWIRRASAARAPGWSATIRYAELPMSTDERYLAGQVVLVGYGRVGRRMARGTARSGHAYVVVEQNRERSRRCARRAACGRDAATRRSRY